jgi:hypothetical protein
MALKNGQAIEKRGGTSALVTAQPPQKAPEKPVDSSTSATPKE